MTAVMEPCASAIPAHMSHHSSVSEEDMEEASLKTIRSSATDMAESLFDGGEDDDVGTTSRPDSGMQKRKAAGFDDIKRLWPSRSTSALRFSMAIGPLAGSPRQGEGLSLAGSAVGSQTDPGNRYVPPIARSRSEGYVGPVDDTGRPLWRPSSGIAVRFKLRELNQQQTSPQEASHPNKKLAGDGSPTRRVVSFSPASNDGSPLHVAALQRALSGAHLICGAGKQDSSHSPSACGACGSAASSVTASPLAPKKLAPSSLASSPVVMRMKPPPITPSSAPVVPPPPMPILKAASAPPVAAPAQPADAPAAAMGRSTFWDFQQPQAAGTYRAAHEPWTMSQGRSTYAAPPAPQPQWGADPYAGGAPQLIPTGVPAGMMIDPSQGMMIDPNDPGYGYVYVVPEPGFYEQALAAQQAASAVAATAMPGGFFATAAPSLGSPPMGSAPPPMAGAQMASIPNMMLSGMPQMQHWAGQARLGAAPSQHRLGAGAPIASLPPHGQTMSPPMVGQARFGELAPMAPLPPSVTMPMMAHPGGPMCATGSVAAPQQPVWAPTTARPAAHSHQTATPNNSRSTSMRGQHASFPAGTPADSGQTPIPGGPSNNRRTNTRSSAAERMRGARLGLVVRATEQKQSRLLQQELMRMSDTQLQGACDELAPHLLELATHPFGNYVISKLASRAQAHDAIYTALRGHVVELLKHPQGSRVVQTAISELPPSEGRSLVDELDRHVLECALDTHGSWGVCVAFKHTHAAFIVAQMAKHINALCTQQHGVRVVQQVCARRHTSNFLPRPVPRFHALFLHRAARTCWWHASPHSIRLSQRTVSLLYCSQVLHEAAAASMDISAAVSSLLEGELSYLAAHPFGNYAVQAALRHAVPAQRATMLEGLLPSILHLASSKHGSNVAEMVLMLCSEDQLEHVRSQVFGPVDAASAEVPQLRLLMSSPFGNYVLQALLRKLKDARRVLALQMVERHVADDNFGRAILAAAASTA